MGFRLRAALRAWRGAPLLEASRYLFNTAFLTRRVCGTEGRDCSITFELGVPVFTGMERLDPV